MPDILSELAINSQLRHQNGELSEDIGFNPEDPGSELFTESE